MVPCGYKDYFKDAILEGEVPFNGAHGMSLFEDMARYLSFTKPFNSAVSGQNGLNTLVDVGGGNGSSLSTILNKCPSINGINFDMPYLLVKPPLIMSMLEVICCLGVPEGDSLTRGIFGSLGYKNSLSKPYHANPEGTDTILESKLVSASDINMLAITPVGRERTRTEFEALSKAAAFSSFQ
ncbi:O-methyltransferase domain, partial [Dillenia turbinata]